MKAFLLLSPLVRSLFQFWCLLLCLVSIFGILYAVSRRFRRYALGLSPCLLGAYFLRQIILGISEFHMGGAADPLCLRCGSIPWGWYAGLLAVLTAAAVWLVLDGIRFGREHISIGTIKHYADSMPCGMCYWRTGGRVIFANDCMARLCYEHTGLPLLNGDEFYQALPERLLTIGGKVWLFTHNTVELRGVPLHELICTDVTELSAKTEALQKENEKVARYSAELRAYQLHLDETVRQQEILQAKTNIHDGMNRLILSTIAAGTGAEERRAVLRLWQNNALLLCLEADTETGRDSVEALQRIAAALKLELVLAQPLPDGLSEKQKNLLFSAAQEALANTYKHSGTKALEVSFQTREDGICCRFSNDGLLPEGPVSFSGGLGNLKSLAELQGAALSVETDERFCLCLFFPKEPKNLPAGRCEA